MSSKIKANVSLSFPIMSIKLSLHRALSGYHFKCECVACTHKWPVYDRLVERPPQYKKKLTPELTMEVSSF